ncbi:MAG TPA: sugar ABC transporter permease [Jiangellaceae bacterium]|nr:sugar ABC transporter permease [Jiangellaceae bacterium]
MTTTEGAPPPPAHWRTGLKEGSTVWTVVLVLLFVAAIGGAAIFLLNVVGVLNIELDRDFWPTWMVGTTTWSSKLLLMVIAILMFAAVMTVVLISADRAKRVPNWAVAAAFFGPAALMLGLGLLYPAVRTIRESFFDRTGDNFIGWDNYVAIFTQSGFQLVLRNTLIWVILVPIVATFIGLVYAVLVDRTRFEALAKGLIFLPMAISLVGASIIWRFVYAYRPEQEGVNQIGLLNQILVWFGFSPQQFIITAPGNTLWLIVVMVWIQTGLAMTLLSAAIKNIPDDIIEAARLDGLSGFRMFRYITVPSIRPALVVVAVAITMTTLKAFDIIYTMTGGQFETSVVANEFYFQSFRQGNFGVGATLAVFLFVAIIPVVIYQVRQLRLAEEIR